MKLSHILHEKANVAQGVDEAELAYLQKAADLLSRELKVDNHNITISFDPPMDLDNSQYGVTIGLGHKPQKIFIMVDKGLSTGDKLLNLCHEMVHAQQLAHGHLTIEVLKDGQISGEWNGKKFSSLKYSKANPWEVEAHTKDKQLRKWVVEQLGNFTS